jgi:hypothetical protein
LHLRTGRINNLLRPAKCPRCRSYLLDNLLKIFSLLLTVSVRHVDIASKAAFTASRASFESAGMELGSNLRADLSVNYFAMIASPFFAKPKNTRDIGVTRHCSPSGGKQPRCDRFRI